MLPCNYASKVGATLVDMVFIAVDFVTCRFGYCPYNLITRQDWIGDSVNWVTLNSYFWVSSDSYFFEHKADQPHPHMPSTGTEGRCELCGQGAEGLLHKVNGEREQLYKEVVTANAIRGPYKTTRDNANQRLAVTVALTVEPNALPDVLRTLEQYHPSITSVALS